MKRLILIIAPIIVGIGVFLVFLFFYTSSNKGKGALQITASPASTVYVNGKLMGKTPLCLCEGKAMLPSGVYTLKLTPIAGDNLLPYTDTVVITKSTLTVVDRTFGVGELASGSVITLLPLSDPKAVEIFIASFPTSASVTLDGNSIGQTPLLKKNTTDSDHDVTLSRSGYSDKTIHIHTVLGYQLKAVVTLGLSVQAATQSGSFESISPTPVAKTKVVILDTPTGFLRVRTDPTLGASETAQVKPGDSFDFVDEQDGWYEIALPDGKKGWISNQYAKKQ